MPARKMRVKVSDDDGNRYTIAFQGRVTREKALRILDIVELLGGMRGINPKWSRDISELSKYDKVRLIIDKYLPIVWFSSREVHSIYGEEFKEPISLSTVSTYLSRMKISNAAHEIGVRHFEDMALIFIGIEKNFILQSTTV